MPALRIGAQSTNAAAATALDNAIQPYLASEAKALQAAAGHGTTGAFFSYGQNIQIAGKPVQLIASMWVPTQGAYQFLGVKVGAQASESVLYVTYQQSQTAALLPANWTMPGAGNLTWSLATFAMSGSGVGATMTVTSAGTPTTIATRGLYDEPRLDNTVIDNCTAASGNPLLCDQPNPGKTYPATVNGQTVTFDHNVGLDLMIQKAVLPLMAQTGAVQAVVIYGRTVQPVYGPAGASGAQPAMTAATITTRTFTGNGCGPTTLADSGSIGYLLDESESEYLVTPGGSHTLIGTPSAQAVSPTTPFTQSALLPAGSTPGQYTNDIVNPWGGGQVYNWQNDTVNNLPASDYVYVASLQQQGVSNNETSMVLPGNEVVCVGGPTTYEATVNFVYGNRHYGRIRYQSNNVAVNGSVLSNPNNAFGIYSNTYWEDDTFACNIFNLPDGYSVAPYQVVNTYHNPRIWNTWTTKSSGVVVGPTNRVLTVMLGLMDSYYPHNHNSYHYNYLWQEARQVGPVRILP